MVAHLELRFAEAPAKIYSVHREYAGGCGARGCHIGALVLGSLRASKPPKLVLTYCTTHPPPPAASGTPQRTPNSNFLRGVRWSPDGACLLTASDDNWWVRRARQRAPASVFDCQANTQAVL
jgi:hypothetical protein